MYTGDSDANKKRKMSLSFVSKSVQTSTEDGGFVEQAIEGSTTEQESTGVHKPLFEQLRANKEQEEAEQEEYQKALMRGTLALDEEDVAHLESLRRQRKEKEDEVNRRTEEELAAFRAARADRSEESKESERREESKDPQSNQQFQTALKPKLLAPQIKIKRKRLKEDKSEVIPEKKAKSSATENVTEDCSKSVDQSLPNETKDPGLGSLLTGYGSSSDEE